MIGKHFVACEDASADGLTLTSPYVESDRIEHRAGKRVVAREKERQRREEADVCVHVYTRVRAHVCVWRGLFSD